jgi:hypothetical protein
MPVNTEPDSCILSIEISSISSHAFPASSDEPIKYPEILKGSGF